MTADPIDRVREIAKRVSNWGRWGSEDERGTLNLITPQVLKRAAACVRTGRAFSLGLEFGPNGPQTGIIAGRFNPQRYMTVIGQAVDDKPGGFRFSDDVISMPLQCATQWDSLAHVHYDGRLYNGYAVEESLGTFGAARNGIDKQAPGGIMSRGILLDIPRLRGVDRLEPGTAIGPEELDAAVARQSVEILPGDILVVRTGIIQVFLQDGDRETYLMRGAGLGMACVEWMRERDLAAICADNTAIEVMPCEDPDVLYPVHMLGIRDMGMPFGEMFYLEDLAADCAEDGVYEFLLCAPPLKVTNGIGSPINPLAVK